MIFVTHQYQPKLISTTPNWEPLREAPSPIRRGSRRAKTRQHGPPLNTSYRSLSARLLPRFEGDHHITRPNSSSHDYSQPDEQEPLREASTPIRRGSIPTSTLQVLSHLNPTNRSLSARLLLPLQPPLASTLRISTRRTGASLRGSPLYDLYSTGRNTSSPVMTNGSLSARLPLN